MICIDENICYNGIKRLINIMNRKTISEVMREMGKRGGMASAEARRKSGKMNEWAANVLKARRKNKKIKKPRP